MYQPIGQKDSKETISIITGLPFIAATVPVMQSKTINTPGDVMISLGSSVV